MTPPTVCEVPTCASLLCVTPGCQHPLRLGGLVFQLDVVGAELVEDPQP